MAESRWPASRSIATKGPPRHGATFTGWQTRHATGPYHVLSTAADIETQLQWLAARKPAYLTTYASLLKELALASRNFRNNLSSICCSVLVRCWTTRIRDLCRGCFGADIADTYGAEEVGHLAAQCPECGEYHVSAEAARVEI